MPPCTTAHLREALCELYQQPEVGRVFTDERDRAYLNVHLLERSIAALAPRLSGKLLDVGCGTQPYRPYLGHLRRIVACDYDATRGQVDFACPAHNIPVEAEEFHAILCTEVLEHVPDPAAVWEEFWRILEPGGRVLLSTPMYWPPHEEPYDFYRYPYCGLRHLAEQAGFTVEALWPRGGTWAFFGQVGMHVLPHYIERFRLSRVWNRCFLRLDERRRDTRLTMGWTLLAQKPPQPA